VLDPLSRGPGIPGSIPPSSKDVGACAQYLMKEVPTTHRFTFSMGHTGLERKNHISTPGSCSGMEIKKQAVITT